MIKIIIIIFLGVSTISFSQNSFTTGLRIGYNSSTFLGKNKPGKKLYSMPGIYLGATFQYPLNKILTIDADVALNTKGVKINTVSTIHESIYLLYIDVPIMAKTFLGLGKHFQGYMAAGNSFGFNVAALSSVGEMENVKTIDLSALIEAGFKWRRASLSARYAYAYTRFDNSESRLDLRNSTLSILTTFYFKDNCL